MKKPHIAIVVQRYGAEVVGGAELQARLLAESLLPYFHVDVLTTCALDYNTWGNYYPAGRELLNGVTVYRFNTTSLRDANFDRWWSIWRKRPRTPHDELQWVYEQGPVVPDMLAFISAQRNVYDVFIFSTYLYFPSVVGMPLVADKAIFLPNANPNEAPLFFSIFSRLLHVPRAIIYNTHEERDYVFSNFENQHIPHEIIGLGFSAYVSDDISRFRYKYAIRKPYILFLGRIGKGKGCDELLRFFQDYLEHGGQSFQLVLAGTLEITLPDHSDIIHVGVIDGQDKVDALSGAAAIVSPSPWDCLSMQSCEGWAAGRPVLVTSKSPVVSGLAKRSGGGAVYDDSRTFCKLLERLAISPGWADELGKRGQAFIMEHYSWPAVTTRLRGLIVRTIEQIQADQKCIPESLDTGRRANRSGSNSTKR